MATYSQCQQALDRFAPELEQWPHVIGLGIVATNELGIDDSAGDRAIAVYVDHHPQPVGETNEPPIPKYLELMSQGKRVRIPIRIVVEGGPLELE